MTAILFFSFWLLQPPPPPPPAPPPLLWQRDCLQFLHMGVLALSWFCFFYLWVCHNAAKLVWGHKWTDLNRCPEHNEHMSERMVSISTFILINTSCPSCTSQLTRKAQYRVQTTGFSTLLLIFTCFEAMFLFTDHLHSTEAKKDSADCYWFSPVLKLCFSSLTIFIVLRPKRIQQTVTFHLFWSYVSLHWPSS